jgi:PleD family two-component response regulator
MGRGRCHQSERRTTVPDLHDKGIVRRWGCTERWRYDMAPRRASIPIKQTANNYRETERPVEMAQDSRGVRIVVIGDIGEIRSALPSAIRDEAWQWQVFPTMDGFLAAPRHPRTVVIPVIDTFTIASLELIRNLTLLLDLPVVVFALERHPVMVRAALEAGADDVIAIPSSIEEILVRLRAIVRVAFSRDDGCGEQTSYRLDDADSFV